MVKGFQTEQIDNCPGDEKKNFTNSLKVSSSHADQDDGNILRKKKKNNPKIHPEATHYHSDDNW